jgi:2-phospho-L-lactate guanylyltransferase
MTGTVLLIPCKPLDAGKSRLAPVLSARQRRDLCAHLLARTLRLATDIAERRDIFLVTADRDATAQARVEGFSVIVDQAGTLNGALRQARERVVADSPALERMLILPIDLVSAHRAALGGLDTGCDVTIVGDRTRFGTNVLMLRDDAARRFPFRFGTQSLARHASIARRMGYSLAVITDCPQLSFDLDAPEDYRHAVRMGYLPHAEPDAEQVRIAAQ